METFLDQRGEWRIQVVKPSENIKRMSQWSIVFFFLCEVVKESEYGCILELKMRVRVYLWIEDENPGAFLN